MKTKNLLLTAVMTFIVISATAQTWNCGSPNAADVTATLSNGTLTVSGTGKMADSSPWYNVRDQIQKVVIENGVTSIGASAFLFCTSVVDLSIGNTVETISEGAFWMCNISFVNIPDGVKRIEDKAFAEAAVIHLVIPSSVTEILDGAFAKNTDLTEISVSWNDPADVKLLPPCENCVGDIDPFWGIDKQSVILHVPKGTKAAYQAASVWKEFIIIDDGVIPPLLKNLTISAGKLSPVFKPTIYSYRVVVPQSIESIVLTAIPIDETVTVSGDGKKALNTGENTFNITVTAAEKSSVYTIDVTRAATDILLDLVDYSEITTGATGVTYYDYVINGNKTVPVIDKYTFDYELTTGNVQGNLPLHFNIDNGRKIFDKTVSVEANSIYNMTLTLSDITYLLLDISFSTYMDDYGRPSYTTIEYKRHSGNVVASTGSDELSTKQMDFVGSGFTSVSLSDLARIGGFTSIKELSVTTPSISVFPNPAADQITISGLQPEKMLYIYNVSGQQLFFRKATGETEQFSVSRLPSGIYFVKTSNGQALKWIKK